MGSTKRERLDEILRRLKAAVPFHSGDTARSTLETIMRTVEDEFSGVPENPNAATAPPDGRMYPPHEIYEKVSPAEGVRLFRQSGHLTLFGRNGAIRIQRSDGVVELDEPGADLRTISDLLSEKRR